MISFGRRLGRYLADLLGCAVGFFRRKQNYVVEQWEGQRSFDDSRRVAILAHYDTVERVADYVLFYIDALNRAGFAVVFVSNAPKLGASSILDLQSRCALVLRRRNLGHDFGAYKDGLSALGELSRFDEIILANDSVYGPFFDLAPLLARCDDSAAIWGMTDSWEQRYHLQTYFILVKKAALRDRRFLHFWQQVRYLGSRHFVINWYEIGFTQAMLAAELRCAALFPSRGLTASISAAALSGRWRRDDLSPERRGYLQRLFDALEAGLPLNPTHVFWDYLIGELGFPFLKRDVLTRNPLKLPFVNQWQALLQRDTAYDSNMIVDHLKRVTSNRSI
jgi:lipopolysaccharide biosynthesis protein